METSEATKIRGMSFVGGINVVQAARQFTPTELNELFTEGEIFPGTDLRIDTVSSGFRINLLDGIVTGYTTPVGMLRGVRSLASYSFDRGRGDHEILKTVDKESATTTLDDLLDIFSKPQLERDCLIVPGLDVTNLFLLRHFTLVWSLSVDVRIHDGGLLFAAGRGKRAKGSRLIVPSDVLAI